MEANFSSLDDPYIDQCISNVEQSSNRTVLVAYDRLFSGQSDLETLNDIIHRNKKRNVTFEIIPLPSISPGDWFALYSRARLHGHKIVRNTAKYTLFLDGDEIADKEMLQRWRTSASGYPTLAGSKDVLSVRFENYWFFREPIYQSFETECSPLMVSNTFLDFLIEHGAESLSSQLRDRDFFSFDSQIVSPPIFHHFSWARTKEQMLEKVRNWAHQSEKNWPSLIEREFSHEFNGTDFVHGYKYRLVDNVFNIKL